MSKHLRRLLPSYGRFVLVTRKLAFFAPAIQFFSSFCISTISILLLLNFCCSSPLQALCIANCILEANQRANEKWLLFFLFSLHFGPLLLLSSTSCVICICRYFAFSNRQRFRVFAIVTRHSCFSTLWVEMRARRKRRSIQGAPAEARRRRIDAVAAASVSRRRPTIPWSAERGLRPCGAGWALMPWR